MQVETQDDCSREEAQINRAGGRESANIQRKMRGNFHRETGNSPADPPKGIQEEKRAETACVHKPSRGRALGAR